MKKVYLFLLILAFMFIPKLEAKTFESEKLEKEQNYMLNISDNSAMNVVLLKKEDGTYGVEFDLKFGTAESVTYKLEVVYLDENGKELLTNYDTFYYKNYDTDDTLYNRFKELSLDYDEIKYYKIKLDYNEFEIPEEKFSKRNLLVDNMSLFLSVNNDKSISAEYNVDISSKNELYKYEFYIDKKSNPNDKGYIVKISNLRSNYDYDIEENDDRYIVTFHFDGTTNKANLKFSYDYNVSTDQKYISVLDNHGNNMIINYSIDVSSKYYEFETKLYTNDKNEKIEKISDSKYSLSSGDYFELNDKIYLNVILGREKNVKESPIISDLITNFSLGDADYRYIWVTFSFIALTILYLTLVHLKNKEKPAPDKNILSRYNSAEIGYLYSKHVNNKHIVSLLVWLCNKGYIKIVDLGYDFNIIKVKKYDGNDYIERKFFNSIFAKEDEMKLSKLLKGLDYRHLKKKLTYSRMIHELYSRNYRLFGFVLDFLAACNCFIITYYIISFKYSVKENILYYILLSIALTLLVTKTIPLIFKHFKNLTQFGLNTIICFNIILLVIIGIVLFNFKMIFSNYLFILINIIQLALICLSLIIIKSTCIFSDNAKNIMIELNNLENNTENMASKGMYKYLPVFFAINKFEEYFEKVNYDKFVEPEWFEADKNLSTFGIRIRIRALFEMLNK